MPSHASQEVRTHAKGPPKGETTGVGRPPPCNCPHKNASGDRECCFQIRKGVNKNATSSAARRMSEQEREDRATQASTTKRTRGQAHLQGSCHFLACSATTSHLFLHLLRLHHTWIRPSIRPSIHPSIHPSSCHSPYLRAPHLQTHLISIAITDAPPLLRHRHL